MRLLRVAVVCCFAWIGLATCNRDSQRERSGLASADAASAAGPESAAQHRAVATRTTPAESAPPSTRSPCGEKREGDEALYDFLTAGAWAQGGRGGALPGTLRMLKLRRDGTFEFTANSDVTERDDRGAWNFLATGRSAGILCLAGHSVLAFVREGEDLALLTHRFQRADAAEKARGGGSRTELPRVGAPQLFWELAGHRWHKLDPFNLFMDPEHFLLSADGTFQASYRSGSCQHSGRWSIDRDYFVPISNANSCDLRMGGSPASIGASNERPKVDGDALHLHRAVYRRDKAGEKASFVVGQHGPYAAELELQTRDGQAELELRVRAAPGASPGMNAATLESLVISAQKLSSDWSRSGLSGVGKPQTLLARKYGEALVVGKTERLRFALPKTPGLYSLSFELHYKTAAQPFTGRFTGVVELPL